MKLPILTAACLLFAAPAFAADARLAYQGTDGQYRSALVASPVCGVNASGAPILCKGGTDARFAYKATSGQYQSAILFVPVCSVDANGVPQTCDFSSPAPDLSGYLQKTGGDLTGDIYLRNGISIYACSRSGSCANLYASGNQTLTWYGVGDINVGGGGGFSALSLGGTGNAYACLNSVGKIYRSATACQ